MNTLNQIKVEEVIYDIEDTQARKELQNKADKNEIPKVITKTSELENDSGFITEHQDLSDYAKKNEIPSIDGLATEEYVEDYVDNAIANIDIPSGGEGGGSNAFYFTQKLEEDVWAVTIPFPVNFCKIVQFNIHCTFATVSEDISTQICVGGKYRNLGTIAAGIKAFDLYALYYFNWGNTDVAYYAYGYSSANNSADVCRPSLSTLTSSFTAATNRNDFSLQSKNGVKFPKGTRFEVWGVCTQ